MALFWSQIFTDSLVQWLLCHFGHETDSGTTNQISDSQKRFLLKLVSCPKTNAIEFKKRSSKSLHPEECSEVVLSTLGTTLIVNYHLNHHFGYLSCIYSLKYLIYTETPLWFVCILKLKNLKSKTKTQANIMRTKFYHFFKKRVFEPQTIIFVGFR